MLKLFVIFVLKMFHFFLGLIIIKITFQSILNCAKFDQSVTFFMSHGNTQSLNGALYFYTLIFTSCVE
jgi:hypothetical protein